MKYVDSNTMIKLLEEEYNMSISELVKSINSYDITITEEEIKKYLNKELEKELYLRKLDNPKGGGERFMHNLILDEYEYNPYTMEYYKKYIDILKKKSLSLIDIILDISTGKIDSKILEDLDIQMDNNLILNSDLNRLLKPTIYNIDKLREMIAKGNKLKTYKEGKIVNPIERGISEEELYPSVELQIKNLDLYYHSEGYVKLTNSQKEKLESESNKILLKTIETLKNIF